MEQTKPNPHISECRSVCHRPADIIPGEGVREDMTYSRSHTSVTFRPSSPPQTPAGAGWPSAVGRVYSVTATCACSCFYTDTLVIKPTIILSASAKIIIIVLIIIMILRLIFLQMHSPFQANFSFIRQSQS